MEIKETCLLSKRGRRRGHDYVLYKPPTSPTQTKALESYFVRRFLKHPVLVLVPDTRAILSNRNSPILLSPFYHYRLSNYQPGAKLFNSGLFGVL